MDVHHVKERRGATTTAAEGGSGEGRTCGGTESILTLKMRDVFRVKLSNIAGSTSENRRPQIRAVFSLGAAAAGLTSSGT